MLPNANRQPEHTAPNGRPCPPTPESVRSTSSTSTLAVVDLPAPAPVNAPAPVGAPGIPPFTGEDVVKDFLHSLVQPMDHLLPKFIEAGVEDEVSLRSLAALPEEARLKLLRTDLQLNLLQSRIIDHGLAHLDA